MMKSYLVAFAVKSEIGEAVNSLVLIHAESFENAVEKLKAKRIELGSPIGEDSTFTNATIE
jgi:hypothetical protein